MLVSPLTVNIVVLHVLRMFSACVTHRQLSGE
nr:MAG TPA: hypothetical protein [Caudoviricetes sp.]